MAQLHKTPFSKTGSHIPISRLIRTWLSCGCNLSVGGTVRMRIGLVSPRIEVALAVAWLALLSVSNIRSCEFVEGYFYQVTALRGQVVGTTSRGLPRWLRQSIARKHVKVTLYEYRRPSRRIDQPLVKTVETDGEGKFDFGPLKAGHYELVVGDVSSLESFDVEVTEQSRVTESVTIDASPFYPDCSGGHEFIVKTK
jgi:hypothetical protein